MISYLYQVLIIKKYGKLIPYFKALKKTILKINLNKYMMCFNFATLNITNNE